MKIMKFPFEIFFLGVKGEEIIWIKGKPFVVRTATKEDIERLGKGYFSVDSMGTEDVTG